MNACEYLARVGFDALLEELGGPTPTCFDDESPCEGVLRESDAPAIDHARVRDHILAAEKPLPRAAELLGAKWLGRVITWPDRVPGLVTWSGNQSLPEIIRARVKALAAKECGTLLYDWMTTPVPKKKGGVVPGHSGLDALCCQNKIDVGFSPATIGMPVAYRPALELLAIVGLESVPLVSFAARECGFVHDGKIWRFVVEQRDGGYYHRWGDVREYVAEAVRV